MKSVSFIIPVYNQPEYFATCLDAVWFQDYPEIEIILVNDGSEPETGEAIDAYLRGLSSEETSYAANFNETSGEIERVFHKRYPETGRTIRYIEHETNKGLGAALNTGFKACTGDYCTYIACDDYPYPHMTKQLVTALDNGADFAYGDMNIVDDNARILRRFALPDYDFEATFCHWYLCGICKMYRRELHDRFGWYREDFLAHDHDLYLRFAMNGMKLKHVAEPLAAVRFHDADRLVDNHRPENWLKLLDESRGLVRQAREFMASADGK